MKAQKQARMPGEEAKPAVEVAEETDGAPEATRAGTTELNNIAGKSANEVGTDRENVVRAMAMADAARRGVAPDLAPAADIGKPAEPASLKRKAIINGVEVEVEVPTVRRNSAVAQFGPESKHARGALVNKDGSLFEGAGEPYGVIGDINTPQGKLVNRIIPLDAVKSAA